MAWEDVLVWLGFGLVVAASVLSIAAGLLTRPADAPSKISKNLLRLAFVAVASGIICVAFVALSLYR